MKNIPHRLIVTTNRLSMKINQRFIIPLFSILLSFFLSPVSFAEPANLTLLKQKIQAYHDSGTYQKELSHVLSQANIFILHRSALNAHLLHPKKLAVVLDIDETCLSNYDKMVARQFGGPGKPWHDEALAADAPAIKPMLSFYNGLLKHGIAVFFVTGRTDAEALATKKNLKAAGYHDWSGLYFKPNQYKMPSAIPFKSHTRALITQKGYTIIASIGDQKSDLKGGYAEKGYKLPNPYYYIP